MHRYLSMMVAAGVILAVGSGALAVTEPEEFHHVVFPSSVSADSLMPDSTFGDFPAGWDQGCWIANGTANKTFVYFTPEYLFGGQSVKIGDIQSISWFTKKDTPHNGLDGEAGDWYMQIYTQPFSGGDANWYGHRINTEPYLTGANATTAPPNEWNQWSTDAGVNQLRFFDANRPSVGWGSYTDPTWADVAGGPIDWSDYWGGDTDVVDYSGEDVKWFSMAIGSDWAEGFTGGLDGLRIELISGDIATVNFEPIPEPFTMITLFGGVAALGSYVRRRTKA